jgi:phosphoribosylformylglycinamidine synthase I
MKTKVAVIMFPGNNCEEETRRACIASGMDAVILRWNTKEDLKKYDGFVLPGGWSYEDRIRAGVIASKDSILKTVKEQSVKGKPVFGICNGAQVLIETGMIPGIRDEVQMALAQNMNSFVSGFYCTWVYVKNCVEGDRCAFTRFMKRDDVIPIPIAHGEGRFTTRETGLLKKLEEKNQIVLRYCDAKGATPDKFPVNPNGSMDNIAGVCNPEGNVMAMMPHPERSSWNRQVPGFGPGTFADMNGAGPARKLFESMREYIERRGSSWK